MIADLADVNYTYPGAADRVLTSVNLRVREGDFTLVAGPSAGGKSTLVRLFNGLIPQFYGGKIGGSIVVDDHDPSRTPTRELAAIAGMVFQEPEAQGVSDTVEDEIAFGMEQHAVPPREMASRLDELLERFGIAHLRARRLRTLSGGERQRVAIAAALALRPRLLLLDEPTSQLDPAGADAVINTLASLPGTTGTAVLVVEHRLERLLHRVGRVVEVAGGTVREWTPREAALELTAVPPVVELGRRLGLVPPPLTIDEFRAAALGRQLGARASENLVAGDPVIKADGLTAGYGDFVALRDASFTLHQGEVIALVGANGSGKSTLFRAITGLLGRISGTIAVDTGCGLTSAAGLPVQRRTAGAGLVPQDPSLALFKDTVRDEVAETLHLRRRPPESVAATLEAWDISHLAGRNPRDLSVGQQQRVAIAAMLAHEPRAWLLDEPTRGADAEAKTWLAARLCAHAAGGGAAIVATHDIESAALFATRVIGLDGGEIVFDLPARVAFAADGPCPTQIARVVAGATVVSEVEW